MALFQRFRRNDDASGTAAQMPPAPRHVLPKVNQRVTVLRAGHPPVPSRVEDEQQGTFVIASPAQANQVAAIALQKQMDIPDTIKVAQGAPVQVFVARDLDFSYVAR